MLPRIAHFQRSLPASGVLLVATACGSFPFAASQPPPGPTSAASAATLAAEPFDTERAWAHLVALSDLGARPSGSAANREALEYIRTRMEELDLELVDVELPNGSAQAEERAAAQEQAPAMGPGEAAPATAAEDSASAATKFHHLSAVLPGTSPDRIVLAAHYDTRATSPGANDGASGPAVLLELARQLVARPLPYTVEIVFLDGAMGVAADDPTTPLLAGPRAMADYLREAGALDAIRLAVFYREVGDAELTIGRDLLSHRMHREIFFDVARELGLGDAFPRDRGYVESDSSHRSLIDVGMPRVVLIHDPWYGGDEAPGEYWGGEQDVKEHCAPESLHTVGVVSLAALRRISARLEKVDRVSGRAGRRRAETLEPAHITGEAVEETPPAGEAVQGTPPSEGAIEETPPSEPPPPAPESVEPAPESP